MKKKIVLGFSGGLDTSFCVKWLQEHDFEPICVTLDIGQEKDINDVRKRAQMLNVKTLEIVGGQEDFINYFVQPALLANALYQGVYPLATALSRPFVAKTMVDGAVKHKTKYFAHGCTGKGNDQVRIELGLRALLPDAEIIAPVRDNNLSREKEIDYLRERGIDIGFTREKPYSIDQNPWGRSICAGVLEDTSVEPPEEVFEWTRSIDGCPDSPEEIEIEFKAGAPCALNKESMTLTQIIEKLNEIGGIHGIGRIDHIEDRLIGIKTREIYEAPAATILIKTHQGLETLTLSKSSLDFKKFVESEYAKLIYEGKWFSHHHMDIVCYLLHNQRNVSGVMSLKLYKGNCIVTARESDMSLYDRSLATYSSKSIFDQRGASEFVKFVGLANNVQSKVQQFNFSKETKRLSGPDPEDYN